MRRCAAGAHRDGQAPRIDELHGFHAFPGLGEADAVTKAAGLAEGRIDESPVEAVPAAVLDQITGVTHDGLEDAFAGPALEVGVDRAARVKVQRQVHFAPLSRIQKIAAMTLRGSIGAVRHEASVAPGAAARTTSPTVVPSVASPCKAMRANDISGCAVYG